MEQKEHTGTRVQPHDLRKSNNNNNNSHITNYGVSLHTLHTGQTRFVLPHSSSVSSHFLPKLNPCQRTYEQFKTLKLN